MDEVYIIILIIGILLGAGFVIGESITRFLIEFFSNWSYPKVPTINPNLKDMDEPEFIDENGKYFIEKGPDGEYMKFYFKKQK